MDERRANERNKSMKLLIIVSFNMRLELSIKLLVNTSELPIYLCLLNGQTTRTRTNERIQ